MKFFKLLLYLFLSISSSTFSQSKEDSMQSSENTVLNGKQFKSEFIITKTVGTTLVIGYLLLNIALHKYYKRLDALSNPEPELKKNIHNIINNLSRWKSNFEVIGSYVAIVGFLADCGTWAIHKNSEPHAKSNLKF